MPTSKSASYGVIDFLLPETFHDPARGMDEDAKLEMELSAFLANPPHLQNIGWSAKEAILNEGFYKIETVTPTLRATLSFCPEKPSEGFYMIHRLPNGIPERGIIVKVEQVNGDDTRPSVVPLHPFQHRYVVETAADNRSRSHLIWRVGLQSVRQPRNEISES